MVSTLLTIADENVQKGFCAPRRIVRSSYLGSRDSENSLFHKKSVVPPTAFALSDDWRWMLIGEADQSDLPLGYDGRERNCPLQGASGIRLFFSVSLLPTSMRFPEGEIFWVIQWGTS